MTVNVVLDSTGVDVIRVVRVVAAVSGLDPFAAMDVVDRLPAVVLAGVDSSRGEEAAERLRAVGASASVVAGDSGATFREVDGSMSLTADTPDRSTVREGSGSVGPAAGGFQRASLLPCLVGRFQVVGDLGAGGEADVLLVADEDSRRWVVKQYRLPGWASDDQVLARLVAARDGQSLDSWRRDAVGGSLLWVQDWGTDPSSGLFFEVAEFIEGGSLRLPVGDVAGLVDALAGAVAAFQTAVGAHRDVKPANLLVRGGAPLRLVLADVGLSRTLDASKRYSKRDGSAAYQAPEAAQGLVSRSGDWWSVGMIVAQAALGYHPLALPDGTLPADHVLLSELAQRDVPHLDQITDDRLRLLCQGLLTRDAGKRWGHEQVRAWQRGESPATGWDHGRADSAQAAQPKRVRRVLFEGTDHDSPATLAAAFAENPEVAGRLLFQQRDAVLLDDLRLMLAAEGLFDAQTVLSSYQTGPWEPAFLRLLAEMDPNLPPVLAGQDVTPAGMARLGGQVLDSGQMSREQGIAFSWVIQCDLWRIWRGLPGMQSAADASARLREIVTEWDVSRVVGHELPGQVASSVYTTYFAWSLRQVGDPAATTPMREHFLASGQSKWPDVLWWVQLAGSPQLPHQFQALATIEIAAREQKEIEAAESERRRLEEQAAALTRAVRSAQSRIMGLPNLKWRDPSVIQSSVDIDWLRKVEAHASVLSQEARKPWLRRDWNTMGAAEDALRQLGTPVY